MEERRENNGGEEDARKRQKLPHDVITHHILPWIPIKPLTQYKVVSKQWYSSLTCPNFILNHIKQPLFSHLAPPIDTLFIKSGQSYYLYSCGHDDNVPNYHQTGYLVRLNVKGSDRIFVGSSNGLICSADSYGRYFILWNPTTNQSYRYYSPDYSDLKYVTSMNVSFSWGMGYVSSLNDYKVVRISTNLHIPSGFRESVHVFSLRSNTWKEIGFDVCDWLLLSSPKLANETLYWAKTSKVGGSKVCVSFDLALETFSKFCDLGMSRSNANKLCVMGGCISKCTRDSQKGLLIESMNHSGRVVRVCFLSELSQHPSDLIGFTKTGKIIVAYAWPSRLCLVDLNSTRLLATFEDQGRTYIERFLDKALVPSTSDDRTKACCKSEVEEAKSVLRLIPIWLTSLVYAIVFSQSSTFFTKQGLTMDRSLGPNFSVPPASLQCFISVSVVLFIPIYDRILVPAARTFTGKPGGITMLQRIGIGMLISAVSMVIAAIVERQRLETAVEHGLIDLPNATVPMSVWWLVPQYVLFGISDVFTMVGLQEFFYDQVPAELRSVGLSLYLSVFGTGNLLSSLLVSVVDNATGANGRDSWFSTNLNRGHLDYFYFLLAGLSVIGIIFFVYFAKSYIYNRKIAI